MHGVRPDRLVPGSNPDLLKVWGIKDPPRYPEGIGKDDGITLSFHSHDE